MKWKSLSLNLEIAVRIIIFALVLLGVLIVISGSEFQMNNEAKKTQQRLVDAFIEVAEKYAEGEKYTYEKRYSGGEEPCTIPYTSKKPCGVPVVLPQELTIISTEALPALGDPKYIIYWDSYDFVESEAWSGWFWFDVITTVIPAGKIAKGVEIAGKATGKAAKFIVKYGSGVGPVADAAAKVGKSLVKFGSFIKKAGEKAGKRIMKGTKWVVKEEDSEKGLAEAAKEVKDNLDELYSKTIDEEVKEAKNSWEVAENKLKDIKTMLQNFGLSGEYSITIADEYVSSKGVNFLKKMAKLPGDKARILNSLIKNNKLRFCAPAGAFGALVFEELKKKGIITQENEEYYYEGQPIEQEILWTALLRYSGGKLYSKVLKKTGENTYELAGEVEIMDMSDADPEKWKIYEGFVDENGEIKSKKLGTLKELEDNPKFKFTTLKTCAVAAGVTFFAVDFVHTMEAKYETVKGEAEKCRNTICLKGTAMLPRTYRKEEFQKAMENAKICGIRIMNVKENDLTRKEDLTNIVDTHEFYLASPCFAYAQIWVAKCDNPEEDCKDNELCMDWNKRDDGCHDDSDNNCCRRCIWVALQKGIGLKFQESSAHNYCAWSAIARFISKGGEEMGEGVAGGVGGAVGSAFGFTMPWPWAGYWWFG